MNQRNFRVAAAMVGLQLAALTASAQPPYPYNPYYNPYANTTGAALSGAADVNRSYGDVINAQEQARVEREKANQAKLDTKKQAFDLMLYEKANTPTYVETLTKDKQQILTRMMNFPIKSEVTDGKSLNTMLPFLQSLCIGGTQGPPVPVPQSIVNQLNISGSGTSSVGMLRDGGRVDWPVDLQGKNQMALDKLLPLAYRAAATGKLTSKLMKDVRTEMKTMRERCANKCKKTRSRPARTCNASNSTTRWKAP